MNGKRAILITVTGDVQGVSYRFFAKKKAGELGLSGWARNEHDGSVKMFIQGDVEKVEEFVEWAKEGSPMAGVEGLEVLESELDEGPKGFEVK